MVGVCDETTSIVVRQGAPLATYSIDRLRLSSYVPATDDNQVNSLMRSVRARLYPHIASRASGMTDSHELTRITLL